MTFGEHDRFGRLAAPGIAALALIFALAAGCDHLTLVAVAEDAAPDTDSDIDIDTDTDTDTDADGDGDGGPVDEVIEMDCSACEGVGPDLESMLCAIDLCDFGVVSQNQYTTLGDMVGSAGGCTLEDTYEAVEHYGFASNDLAPKLNDSYAMMSTGLVEASDNSTACWVAEEGVYVDDPFTNDLCWDADVGKHACPIYDAMKWKITMTAPEDAKAFRLKYVFFSAEFDDFIGASFNDKFYVILEADSTEGGAETVINFTECREPEWFDMQCPGPEYGCEAGEYLCYVAVNSALSECCWYPQGSGFASNPDDPPCPGGTAQTDISGTGFTCAVDAASDGNLTGSSTGWLQTAWPIDGGETFSLTFHIHDSEDQVFDSTVIIDSFQFLRTFDQGTIVVIE